MTTRNLDALFNPKSIASSIHPQHIRVPLAADTVARGILQWSGFFLTQIDPQTPMLLTVPLEEPWIDVTLGKPASQQMFCLRASPKSMPLASEVPYTLSEDFRQHARGVLSALEAGRPPASILSVSGAPAASTDAPAPARSWLAKWLGGAAAVILLAAIAYMFARSGSEPAELTGNSPPKASTGEVLVAARLPAETSATPAAVLPPATADSEAPKPIAEEKRRAEEKARTEAAARLKAIADEQEKIRLASEAEKQRLAAEQQVAEAKRAAQDKARTGAAVGDVALLNPAAAKSNGQPATSPQSSRPAVGPERTNGIGMIFVSVPGGYWVGKHEVTQAQFEKVLGRNPSAVNDASRPVESVTWADASEFCGKLTALERANHGLPSDWAYVLPTETQWSEFSADTDLATAITSLQRAKRSGPEPVGSTAANKFGLYDVRGNVWEWCSGANDQKVLRGGGYDGFTATGLAPTLALNYRWQLSPDQRKPQAGFRCVLAKQP